MTFQFFYFLFDTHHGCFRFSCLRRTRKLRTQIQRINEHLYHGFCPSNQPPFTRKSSCTALWLIPQFLNTVVFGALFIITLIELSTSAWITAKYNANHNFPTSAARARVRYLLFVSIWTIVFGSVSLVGFLVAPTRIFTSVASHFFLYVLFYFTFHHKFSFDMLSIASFSHGFYGWQLPLRLFKH